MSLPRKIRLGDLLVEKKVISAHQLDLALAEQKKSGRKLGQVLVETGCLTQDSLLTFLSEQLNVPFVELGHYQFEPDTIKLIPEIHARRFRVIALKQRGTTLLVGMADPTNLFAYDELTRLVHRQIEIAVVREDELLEVIDRAYRQSDQISGLAEQLNDELKDSDFDVDQLAAGADLSEAPVVKLLHSLFQDAVQIKASDIHIEPDDTVLRIRMRVDGILHEQVLNERRIAAALVQRLKLMSNLDIAEKRLPQDGRIKVRIDAAEVDIRVSIIPMLHGEAVVMRLLRQNSALRGIRELGMGARELTSLERVLRLPHGIVLVTGPTGSGKTSTLYTALQEINDAERKIITIEDPIEYQLRGVNQIQVSEKSGLTFARGLRSILRHDPDVILIGEIRDQETAQIAVQASLTGHLVFSTLHTNDAPGAITRLVDMGVEPYLVASSLEAVLAQRLVRLLCPHCKAPDDSPTARAFKQELGLAAGSTVYRAVGCRECRQTGYHGRRAIFEWMDSSAEIRQLILRAASIDTLRDAACRAGMRTLADDGRRLVESGATTIEEVLSVTPTDEFTQRTPGTTSPGTP